MVPCLSRPRYLSRLRQGAMIDVLPKAQSGESDQVSIEHVRGSECSDSCAKGLLVPFSPDRLDFAPRGKSVRVGLEKRQELVKAVRDVGRQSEILRPGLRGPIDLRHTLSPPLPLLGDLPPGDSGTLFRVPDHLPHELFGYVLLNEVDEHIVAGHATHLEQRQHAQRRRVNGCGWSSVDRSPSDALGRHHHLNSSRERQGIRSRRRSRAHRASGDPTASP